MGLRNSSSRQDRVEALDCAIERLYETFARYKLIGLVAGCPCCTTPEDDKVLRSQPMNRLEWKELERFAWKAMTTLGGVEDFKHFLPRLLELAARQGGDWYSDFEVLLGKLRYGDWNAWPEAEQDAVEEYLAALWRHVLGEFPSSLDVSTCLCGIGNVVDDLSPYLQAWRQDRSAAAARHVAEFLDENIGDLFKKDRLSNAFRDERRAQMRQVIDWLIEPATVAWVEKAFFRFADAPFAAELSTAADQLDWLRKRRLGAGQ